MTDAAIYSAECSSDSERFLAWRKSAFQQHPIVIWPSSFVVPTPPMIVTAEAAVSYIYKRQIGAAWWARSRHGKTRVIRYLVRKIAETYPGLPTVCIEAFEMPSPSMLGLYGDLLDGAEYALRKFPRATARKEQVHELFLSLGLECERKQIVLFVDEAQNWGMEEWSWIKSLQIYLEKNEVTMIVLSFGQEQLESEISKLREHGRRDLTARFFRTVTRFYGLRSVNELGFFFEQLDEQRYPLEGGPTYTEFFFPLAYQAGWRLYSDRETAWKCFVGDALTKEVDMEWVCLATKQFLMEASEHDSPTWTSSTVEWRKAIEASKAD